jgi:hypothetical protein
MKTAQSSANAHKPLMRTVGEGKTFVMPLMNMFTTMQISYIIQSATRASCVGIL